MWLLGLGFAFLLGATPAHPELVRLWNGFSQLEGEVRKVTDVTPVERSPLFDNLPFVRLRAGDKFVRAREWSENGKGMKPGFSEDQDNFLFSKGKYFHVWAYEDSGKHKLRSVYDCLSFDWDVTVANALAWKNLADFDHQMTVREYKSVITSLHDKMPDQKDYSNLAGVEINEPKLVTLPCGNNVVIEGIEFDE